MTSAAGAVIRTVLLSALALAVAVVGGAGSFRWLAAHPLPAAQYSGWRLASGDADALYLPASRLQKFSLALGPHEGTVIQASLDDGGDPLSRECGYRLEGRFPLARFWTLAAGDPQGERSDDPALYSGDLLFGSDGVIAIAVGPHPASGNWLPVSGKGVMALTLTLFDTSGAAPFGIGEPKPPAIRRVACDA